MTYKRTTTDAQRTAWLLSPEAFTDDLRDDILADLCSCEQALAAANEKLANNDAQFEVVRRSINRHLLERCQVQGLTHGDMVAYAADEIVKLRAALAAAKQSLRDLEDDISEPSFEDERLKYVEVQISRDAWLALKAKRAARAEEQR